MAYVDSNVFIHAALNQDQKAMHAKEILLGIAKGKMIAQTSALTWDEFVWAYEKIAGKEKARVEGKAFIQFPNLQFIPADLAVIAEAQKLREKYDIAPRDAIHAATAILKGIREIVSDDSDFDQIKEIKRVALR